MRQLGKVKYRKVSPEDAFQPARAGSSLTGHYAQSLAEDLYTRQLVADFMDMQMMGPQNLGNLLRGGAPVGDATGLAGLGMSATAPSYSSPGIVDTYAQGNLDRQFSDMMIAEMQQIIDSNQPGLFEQILPLLGAAIGGFIPGGGLAGASLGLGLGQYTQTLGR